MSERGISQTKPSDDVIIKNLMARVSELEAENQRLRQAPRDCDCTPDPGGDTAKEAPDA